MPCSYFVLCVPEYSWILEGHCGMKQLYGSWVPSLSRDIANCLVADVHASAQLISKPVIRQAICEPKGNFSGTLPSFLGLPSVGLSVRWITKILCVFLVFPPSHIIYEPKGHFSGTVPSSQGLPSVGLSVSWITKILYVFLVYQNPFIHCIVA
jgi:hypothetical protein